MSQMDTDQSEIIFSSVQRAAEIRFARGQDG